MIQHISMLSIFLTALISFFVSGLFGYSLHRMLHQSWSGRFNKSHMTHHMVLYPPADFQSEIYREPGKDNTFTIFLVAASPLIIAPVILWLVGWLPLSLMITIYVVEGIFGFLNDYLHDSFHIIDHWLYKVPGIGKLFKHWTDLHYQHHMEMQTNFGIFFFLFDRILGTFRSVK